MNTLKIATRKSPLAMWQALWVQACLEKAHTDLKVELVPMVSRGDKILDAPLAKVGGKGLFVKELEHSLLEKETDIAVHSMKDVPMFFPEGLELNVICEREQPFDAFVSNNFNNFDDLPKGAVVGTSSLRRQSQLLAARPDLEIKFLRGNVNTRLAKLDAGEYDAIILAAAGLIRLEFEDRIKHELSDQVCLPAAGQGAVGIECRVDDETTKQYIQTLKHVDTTLRLTCERALVTQLNGGCQVPIAGFAVISPNRDELTFEAKIAEVDGSIIHQFKKSIKLESDEQENLSNAQALGIEAAKALLADGADEILTRLMQE